MEWNRGVRPNQPADQPMQHAAPAVHAPKRGRGNPLAGMRLAQFVLIVATVILAAVLIVYIGNFKKSSGEQGFVDDQKMQAVFLNGGQVYFGKVSDLNEKYMRMSDIYYLRVNQQVQPNQTNNQNTSNDISLVKLGCELHGPQDSMVINREQIIFWENLKADGQVAKAVAEYKKQNPQGQKCDTTAQTTDTGNAATQQTTPTNTNTTTNSTSTKKQ